HSSRLTYTSWGFGPSAARRLAYAKLARDCVHRFRKLDILGGDAASVVGREHDLHRLVNIAPFRVMVVLFRDQGGARHEAEGLVEILENEGLRDGLPPARLRPAGQTGKGRFPGFRRQPLHHQDLLNSAGLYPDTPLGGNHDGDVTSGRQGICYDIVPDRPARPILSLAPLFARSMTEEFVKGRPAPPSPRSAARRAVLATLAGVLAIVGALVAGYYFAVRPVTLKIAVGPANSDDVKVVQRLTQAFVQNRAYVRLRPVQTDGPVASAEDLASGKVDLAIIRGD